MLASVCEGSKRRQACWIARGSAWIDIHLPIILTHVLAKTHVLGPIGRGDVNARSSCCAGLLDRDAIRFKNEVQLFCRDITFRRLQRGARPEIGVGSTGNLQSSAAR